MFERQDYYEDQKERNHTARSARQRTGGKKKYLLPSDRMSASELKKMNGEITVYTMKEPISWIKFKSYPKDIQKEYIQWFVDEFGASRRVFVSMFQVSAAPVYNYFKERGYLDMLVKQMTEDNTAKFDEWLKQYRPKTEQEAPVVEEPKKEKVKPVEQPMFFNTITGCEMSMEGKASEIGQMLFNLFRDQKIAVNISFVGAQESESVNA